MSNKDIDPQKARKIINLIITILTAIGSFLGGNAVAKNMDIHLFDQSQTTIQS